MISKRLFLRGMKEDLRHRVWMLALSLLGSFLAMPVMWLLRYSDVDLAGAKEMIANMTVREHRDVISGAVNMMADYFGQELMLSSGVIAIAGAVIVGLESFRFLQQKSMVDTYHSLPVGRMQLFGIKYLSGLLIWLVPCLFCTFLTLAFSGVLLARVGGAGGIPRLLLEAGINIAVLVLVFLLVYHTMLLATMLTGNMLNTLVVAVTLGCGVISVYGMVLGFMSTYFRTYAIQLTGLAAATYSSPLAAPIVLLGSRMDAGFRVSDGLLPAAPACLMGALVLGVLAWFSYLKRPSERAGRGLDLRWIAGPLRLFGGILGGMGGWLFMYYLVGSASRTAWSVFGALLAGMLAYGVLDVVFAMDFRAFFRHNWSMGASMAVMLLVCLGFQRDFMGYDRYLPDQGQIREASIACRSYTGNTDLSQVLSGMQLTDTAQIHAFLERGIENVQGRTHKPEDFQVIEAYRGDSFATDTFQVRVVLENGRSYYRTYFYYEWDEDVVLPLLCSEEYADSAYRLGEDQIEACISMRLTGGGDRGIEEVSEKEVVRELAEAYNRDLSEQPRAIILGQDRLLGQIIVRFQQENTRVRNLDIFEHMSHTLEAMEKNGIQIFNRPTEAEDVESITFRVDGSRYWYKGASAISPVERSIRGYFGVYPKSLSAESGDGADPRLETSPAGDMNTFVPPVYDFTVTDPAEIAQLLPLIQYSDTHRNVGVFAEGVVENVRVLDRQGAGWDVCLRRGALPEEFIQRFLGEAGGQ